MTIDKKMLSVLGIAILSFFSTLWVRPADLMESRNFISAREMVLNNEWLITTLNGLYRFEKPPLPTWLTAITMKLSNNFADEWVLRLPVAMACVLLALYMYKFIDEFVYNKNVAFLSSFALCTTFMITKVGTENTWDAYPYIFMFISLFYCVRLLHSNALRYVFPASFFFACSLLSKGPIAVYGMFLPFFISYGVVYKFEYVKRNKGRLALYILLGLALASFWPIAMMIENADLFTSILAKEKVTWTHNHIRPWYFYLDFFGFMGIWALFTLLTFTKKWNITDEQQKLFQFGRLWTSLTFVLLSLVRMKKERYGFPMYVEFSVPLGIILHQYLENTWSSLKSIERKFFFMQYAIIITACLASVGFLLWKVDTVYGKVLLPIPFLSILLFIIYCYKQERDTFKKGVIFCSGILMICINSNITWLVESTFRGTKHPEIPALEELQDISLTSPVYANHISIEDVWSVGQQIQQFDSTKDLPYEFYILGDFDALPNDYEVIAQRTYRTKQNKDTTVILSTISRSTSKERSYGTSSLN